MIATAGCYQPQRFSPQQAYDASWQKLWRGDLTGALTEADHGLQQFPSPAADWHWRFTVLKAEILAQQHQNKRSLALIETDLPATLATADVAVWQKSTQGADYSFLQQFSDAEKALGEAETLARTHHPELLGSVTLRKGTLSLLRGDLDRARSKYRTALDLAREEKDWFLEAAALGSLGLVAERLGHFDESIDWYQEALKVSEAAGAMGSKIRILGNLGWNHFVMGDYDGALQQYEQAEKDSKERGLAGDQLHWMINVGNAKFELRDYGPAEKMWKEALESASRQDNKSEGLRALDNLSLLMLELGRIDEAERYNREALERARAGGDAYDALFSDLGYGRIQLAKRNFAEARNTFDKVSHDPAADKPMQWEAQARLGQVYRAEGKVAAAERQYQQCIQTVEGVRRGINSEEFRMSFLSRAIEFYDEFVDFLISRGRTADALQVAELSRARTMLDGLGIKEGVPAIPVKGFEPTRLAGRLNTVILSYWLGPHHSYAWVVTPAKVSFFTLPPAPEISALVQTYRKLLVDSRDPVGTENPDGKKLYEILVAPAKDQIPRGARVTVLPDDSLYGLNFETLLVAEPVTHYWIEDVTVVNSNSLVLLGATAGTPGRPVNNLLLLGNTVAPSPEFPALPQAAAEMRLVANSFPTANQTVLSGGQATPAAYSESNPGKYSYIHFVTHGTASRTKPLDSAVILTKAGDSYKLYARDIVQQRLHAVLVTISACRGAGERNYSGEGLVGLTWAFLRAGAHSVIAALWEVSDMSTPQLMGDLYSGINKGESPDAALRKAKLTMIHSASAYRKPFYWAPFQLYRGS
jgi:CHAT domain-containing protein